MKPIREPERIVLYDKGVEIIREAAVSYIMMIADGELSGSKFGKIIEKMIERSPEFSDEKYARLDNQKQELVDLLEYPHIAVTRTIEELEILDEVEPLSEYDLMKLCELPEEMDAILEEFGVKPNLLDPYRLYCIHSLLSEKYRNLLKSGDEDFLINRFLSSVQHYVVVPRWLSFLTPRPAGLISSLLLGYAVPVSSGITKGLWRRNKKLYDMVRDVWATAVTNLHPFQRGPTFQGTQHCVQVLYNLNELFQELGIKFNEGRGRSHDTPEVGAMLSIAAALHDIGKGDILAPPPPADAHAQSGAFVIRAIPIPNELKLNIDCKDFVAEIIDTHNPEDREDIIDEVTVLDFPTGGTKSPAQVTLGAEDKKDICALFHLADVMDITRDRVSAPAAEILETLYGNPINHPLMKAFEQNYKKVAKIIDARKWIDDVTIELSSPDVVRVNQQPGLTREQREKIQDRIDDENDDLKKTGAKSRLKSKGWPSVLEL